MTKWKPLARALVIVAVLVLVAVAYSALANTGILFTNVLDNSPVTNGSVSFGNYRGFSAYLYATGYGWLIPNGITTLGSGVYNVTSQHMGSSGDTTIIYGSATGTLDNYLYSMTVSGVTSGSIGGYTSSGDYGNAFIAIGIIDVTSEQCGQLIFRGDTAQPSGDNYFAYYTASLSNSTWGVVAWSDQQPGSGKLRGILIYGPTVCISPGYYLYVLGGYIPSAYWYQFGTITAWAT